jgi:hypothetical protein
MPKRLLTDRFCAHAKAQEGEVQTDYFDEATKGLALRVSRSARAKADEARTLGPDAIVGLGAKSDRRVSPEREPSPDGLEAAACQFITRRIFAKV